MDAVHFRKGLRVGLEPVLALGLLLEGVDPRIERPRYVADETPIQWQADCASVRVLLFMGSLKGGCVG